MLPSQPLAAHLQHVEPPVLTGMRAGVAAGVGAYTVISSVGCEEKPSPQLLQVLFPDTCTHSGR
jgi:hypothetical protein